MRCLNILPPSMVSLDAIRLSIAFFTISGLDVLGRLSLLEKNRTDIIDAIYQFQISSSSDHSSIDRCGFRGSLAAATALGHCRPDGVVGADSAHPLDTSHITMTYAALNTLLILGDDLSRLDRRGILTGIRALQLPNGSFAATLQGSESDVRFVYCAASICHLLNDWSGADRQAATNYIVNCIVSSRGYYFSLVACITVYSSAKSSASSQFTVFQSSVIPLVEKFFSFSFRITTAP